MKTVFDLSTLQWKVSGFHPEQWRAALTMETQALVGADVPAIPFALPGSVQGALLAAGVIPDWNVGLNARACEWVENRHWLVETMIPADWIKAHAGETICLDCQGIDAFGRVFVNNSEVGTFNCTFVPHAFDITGFLDPSRDNRFVFVFECPPRWLGQVGETSKMTEWKTRFNYYWDWTSRIVQIGIFDSVSLVAKRGANFAECRATTGFDIVSNRGKLRVWGVIDGDATEATVELSLRGKNGAPFFSRSVPASSFAAGVAFDSLDVEPWWPATEGAQPLYTLAVSLVGRDGVILDSVERTIGFRDIEWHQCEGAPEGADPWLCVINGKPVFLRGIDWTPPKAVFADCDAKSVRDLVSLYRDIGCNVFRVWGGAVLPDETFYSICDELGILVWQEFPICSSGLENWPPEDTRAMADLCDIAQTYIVRRQHHASLLLWCGGNELQGALDGGKVGIGRPVTKEHPLIARLDALVAAEDPGRRFLETSASGPRFYAVKEENGKGLHWDVHGPWNCEDMDEWREYWDADDALFRSETGFPSASPLDVLEYTAGGAPLMPCNVENPLWCRTFQWVQWDTFKTRMGREPADIAEYVDWSQRRQAEALAYAARSALARFPRIGGMIIWMGHDGFPCTGNTAIVDFFGRPKPAALALKEIWAGECRS